MKPADKQLFIGLISLLIGGLIILWSIPPIIYLNKKLYQFRIEYIGHPYDSWNDYWTNKE